MAMEEDIVLICSNLYMYLESLGKSTEKPYNNIYIYIQLIILYSTEL